MVDVGQVGNINLSVAVQVAAGQVAGAGAAQSGGQSAAVRRSDFAVAVNVAQSKGAVSGANFNVLVVVCKGKLGAAGGVAQSSEEKGVVPRRQAADGEVQRAGVGAANVLSPLAVPEGDADGVAPQLEASSRVQAVRQAETAQRGGPAEQLGRDPPSQELRKLLAIVKAHSGLNAAGH